MHDGSGDKACLIDRSCEPGSAWRALIISLLPTCLWGSRSFGGNCLCCRVFFSFIISRLVQVTISTHCSTFYIQLFYHFSLFLQLHAHSITVFVLVSILGSACTSFSVAYPSLRLLHVYMNQRRLKTFLTHFMLSLCRT